MGLGVLTAEYVQRTSEVRRSDMYLSDRYLSPRPRSGRPWRKRLIRMAPFISISLPISINPAIIGAKVQSERAASCDEALRTLS
jgi:hypothetical protein